jgi:hypothetical protein
VCIAQWSKLDGVWEEIYEDSDSASFNPHPSSLIHKDFDHPVPSDHPATLPDSIPIRPACQSIMGTEPLTPDNLVRHMSDDSCVVCGDSGHDAWGNCKKLSGPIFHTSPLVKLFGPRNRASTARTTIVRFRNPNSGKTRWVEPAEPAADAPAPIDAKA